MTVSEVFIETLVKAGVRRVYGVVGDSLNGLTDAMRTSGQIDWLHVRHEETAAFAAGAEAQITGKLAVCAGSCGPGNLHLINGLYDCHRTRVPVLAIAAQVPSSEIGSGYFQETHPEHLFKDCSYYCELVSQPEQMPRVLGIAMRTAIARQGVAVVIIPGDIALRDCDSQPLSLGLDYSTSAVLPSAETLEKAAKALNDAETVTILGGANAGDAKYGPSRMVQDFLVSRRMREYGPRERTTTLLAFGTETKSEPNARQLQEECAQERSLQIR